MYENKLAKARKTRKSPGKLSLKKFGPGKLQVEKVWARNIFTNFLADVDNFKKIIFLNQPLPPTNFRKFYPDGRSNPDPKYLY